LVNNVALSINGIPQSCKRLSVSSSPLSLFDVQVCCKLHQESFQYSSQRGRHRCNYTTTEFSHLQLCSKIFALQMQLSLYFSLLHLSKIKLYFEKYFIRNTNLESVFAEVLGLNLKTRGLVRKFK